MRTVLMIANVDEESAATGNEHPDWKEYDEAMVKQDGVVVFVKPENVYGMLR